MQSYRSTMKSAQVGSPSSANTESHSRSQRNGFESSYMENAKPKSNQSSMLFRTPTQMECNGFATFKMWSGTNDQIQPKPPRHTRNNCTGN